MDYWINLDATKRKIYGLIDGPSIGSQRCCGLGCCDMMVSGRKIKLILQMIMMQRIKYATSTIEKNVAKITVKLFSVGFQSSGL